jgi:hypothetical protein
MMHVVRRKQMNNDYRAVFTIIEKNNSGEHNICRCVNALTHLIEIMNDDGENIFNFDMEVEKNIEDGRIFVKAHRKGENK